VNIEEIQCNYDLGSLSKVEFLDLLEKRWVFLDRKIKQVTTKDCSWNDFQLWKSEKHDIDLIVEKIF